MRIGEILFTDESKIILQIVKNAKCSGITHLHVVSISQVSVWAIVTEEQKEKIAITAKEILNARAKHPNSSLADLYNELTMPADLRKAHQANDRAVMKAYGFKSSMTESEIVAELFKLYQKKVNELAEAEAAQKVAKKPRKRKASAAAPSEPA